MDKPKKDKRRRAVFPPDFEEEVSKLPPDERRWRMIQYIEEHGEDVGPGDGYGPPTPSSSGGDDPPD
jgi:hypothetical protein